MNKYLESGEKMKNYPKDYVTSMDKIPLGDRAETGVWQLALRIVASQPASYWAGHSYKQVQVAIKMEIMSKFFVSLLCIVQL
jgi:hypothetical protein